MNLAIKAIYEEGKLRPLEPLEPLELPEHAVVSISLDTGADDPERRELLAHSERALTKTWENDADDVYNALLTQ